MSDDPDVFLLTRMLVVWLPSSLEVSAEEHWFCSPCVLFEVGLIAKLMFRHYVCLWIL
jgi:hypothetical protein